jgi:3'-phosphoadenosine 5'-phosphosulfate (PAPS) 3'-phosphatase
MYEGFKEDYKLKEKQLVKEINGKNIEKITAKKYNQEVGRTALCGPLQKISIEEKEKWNIKNEEYLHSAIKFGLVADGSFDIYLRNL